MERAPCCEMGLKKGPWTPEEDQILINYIQLYGHGNWRALPKQAGLLRCGKSCRLRWTNYLRPDIERGNFSREEEEPMFNLHEMSGNRWSASAARLPGRTENEMGSLASSNPPSFHHTLSKPKSFWSETFLKITATVLLLLLFSSPITSKSLVSASRPMKPSVGATAAATEVSALNRAPTPPSCPSTSTYIPGGGVGGHC